MTGAEKPAGGAEGVADPRRTKSGGGGSVRPNPDWYDGPWSVCVCVCVCVCGVCVCV